MTPGPHDFGGLLDVIRAGKAEKDWHEYQQSLESTRALVEQLSKPGDLVVDACMGTGTTALACMTADGGPRRFIGCDRDEDMFKSARMRVDEQLRFLKEAA